MRQTRGLLLEATLVAAIFAGCSPSTGGSSSPNVTPSKAPTAAPSGTPTASPTHTPTSSPKPTTSPTNAPTPTPVPSPSGSASPTPKPTPTPLPPIACAGQVDFPDHATVQAQTPPGGGHICIPKFGGFGGTLQLPSLDSGPPALSITEFSSTTNYAGYPALGTSGSPIFYLNLVLGQQFQFSTHVFDYAGLASKQIISNSPYTVFGQISTNGVPYPSTSCSEIAATDNNHGGIIRRIASVFLGQGTIGPSEALVEIYPGQLTATPCANPSPTPTPTPTATP